LGYCIKEWNKICFVFGNIIYLRQGGEPMRKILPAVLFTFLTVLFANAQSTVGDEKSIESSVFHNEKSIQKTKVEVFPNPAIDNVFVRIESTEFEKVDFELFNIIGTSMKIDIEELEKDYFRIGIKELPAGYYLLMVKDPVKRFNQAFKIHKTNK
jgi:hypothetical protein